MLKKAVDAKFIFDMRDFWPDEKADSGTWQCESAVCQAAKWYEKELLLRADAVASLIHASIAEMRKLPYLRSRDVRYEMIPTCTDPDLFRPAERRNDSAQDIFMLRYVGSMGTFYLI